MCLSENIDAGVARTPWQYLSHRPSPHAAMVSGAGRYSRSWQENFMGTAQHSPPGEERVTCGMSKKEIPNSEATSTEATDYVSYFCGKHCYDLWRRPHEKFDDQIKPPSTGPTRRCCGKRRARQLVPAAPPHATLPPRGRRQFAFGFLR